MNSLYMGGGTGQVALPAGAGSSGPIPAASSPPPPVVSVTTTPAIPAPVVQPFTITPRGTRLLLMGFFSGVAATGVSEVLFVLLAGGIQQAIASASGIDTAGITTPTTVGASAQALVTGLTPGEPIQISGDILSIGGSVTTTAGEGCGVVAIDLG